MMKNEPKITCKHCETEWDKKALNRTCNNCFCCTGCEIYLCPKCKHEIVVIPIGQPQTCRYHGSNKKDY